MCKIITSATTTTREAEMKVKVSALAAAISEDKSTSAVAVAREDASKAQTILNNSRQDDVFASVLADSTDKPLAILAKLGTYSASAFSVNDKAESSFEDRPALLSLHGMIEYALKSTDLPDDKKALAAKPAEWRSLVKDAVHLSMIKLAQGLKIDTDEYMRKVKASPAVRDAVKNGKKNGEGEMSYAVVQTALQAALDAIIFDSGDRDDAQNKYRVNRQACRWLEASFGVNKVTAAIVNPRDEGMYDRMFQIMRHVIAGMPLTIEVAESKKAK